MNWIWNFYAYSFLGFLLELAFARVTGAKKQDRKCRFFLPICPVYGLGATAITLLPQAIQRSPILLYLSAAFLASAAEYVSALFYEKVWHTSFWNYSALPGNLHGRICLPFAAIWGLLGFALTRWFQPLLTALTVQIPPILLIPTSLLFAVDFAITGHILRHGGSTDSLRWYRE